jgi:hypothetical protein
MDHFRSSTGNCEGGEDQRLHTNRIRQVVAECSHGLGTAIVDHAESVSLCESDFEE